MNKALLLDMDGTIADLYTVPDWLKKLKEENTSPYEEAKPMYDMDMLSIILDAFRALNYRIIIVSWGAKNATNEYNRRIKKAKIEWLKHYDVPYDEIHVIKYGTPKQNFIKNDFSVLVDDNEKVRINFLRSTKGKKKRVIDATQNIIQELLNLLVATV